MGAFAAAAAAVASFTAANAPTIAAVTTAALGVKQLVSSGPSLPPPPAPTPIAAAAPAAPTQALKTGANKSLASLAPGLALAGTGGFQSAAGPFGGKSLLGQ